MCKDVIHKVQYSYMCLVNYAFYFYVWYGFIIVNVIIILWNSWFLSLWVCLFGLNWLGCKSL